MIIVTTNLREIKFQENKIRLVGRGSMGSNLKNILKLRENEKILEIK